MRKILIVIILLLFVSPAEAAYLDLAWDPNTEPDLAGYRIYYGTTSGQYMDFIDVGKTTSYRLDGLQDGAVYYIAATAYDTSGNESDYSNEVSGVSVAEDGADVDGDGLPDDWEMTYFGNLEQGPGGDYDGDGLNNLGEYEQGTNPVSPDTDSDQIPDGWEIQYGLNPLDSSDANEDGDGDGVTNLEEYLAETDPWNAPPTASAGPDQTVDEGATVILDGSNSSDPDDGIASYLWEQTSGIPVTLSDPTAATPTFVTPPVDWNGAVLSFSITVTDKGGLQDSDEISVTIEDNGIRGFPDDVITFTTPADENVGLKVDSGGNCVNLQAIDPSAITEVRKRPKKMIYGMVDMQIKTDTVGGTALVTLYLPTSVPHSYKWYKYSPSTGWRHYRHVVFSPSRDQVTVTLVDGVMGDDDGVANGMIVDPSVLGTEPAAYSPSPGDEYKGCFISTVSRFRIGK